jgi:hypothetical protein
MPTTRRRRPASTGRMAVLTATYRRDGRCYAIFRALRILQITILVLRRGVTPGIMDQDESDIGVVETKEFTRVDMLNRSLLVVSVQLFR